MNTKVNLAGVELKNPVTVASGTFGSGAEYSEFVDLNRLGAVVTKGVANVPWPGNPTPRVAEVYGGMMNAIGLQNPGIDLFCKRDIPFLKKYDTKIIVNVCGNAPEEYLEVVERLADEPSRYDGDQYFLPECKGRRHCFWAGCKACRGDYKRNQEDRKTADHYETESECNRYYRDGEGSRSRRCRCLSLINTLTGMKIDIQPKNICGCK